MNRIVSRLVAGFMLVAMLLAAAGCQPANPAATQTASDATAAPQASEQPADTESAAPSEPAAEETKLSGNIVLATNMTNMVETTLKDLADAFMTVYPDVKVEVEGMADPGTELHTRMAANELPDVTLVTGLKTTDYPTYYVPLDDLGYTKDTLLFYESGLGSDGKLYTVTPNVTYYAAVAYNKKAFAEAGITNVPTTTEEFLAACEALKAKGIVPMATNFKDAWPLMVWNVFAPQINSGNPQYMNDLAKTDTILTDDDNGMLPMLKLLRTMVDKGYCEPDLASTNWDQFYKSDLPTGKVAMAFLGPWILPQCMMNGANAEDLGSFPLPYPNKQGVLATPAWYFAVAKNSKYPDAAKALLKYMIDEGRYANAISADAPSIIGLEGANPFLQELMDYKPNIVQTPASTDEYTDIVNKGQVDFTKLAQEYLIASDPESVVTKYNDIWAAARKAVAGN